MVLEKVAKVEMSRTTWHCGRHCTHPDTDPQSCNQELCCNDRSCSFHHRHSHKQAHHTYHLSGGMCRLMVQAED